MATKPLDIRSLERKLSILSSRYSGGLSVRVSVRPDTDSVAWYAARKSLVLGVRSVRDRPDLPEILRLMVIHELGKLKFSFPPDAEELFSVPPPIRTLMDEFRSDSLQRDRLGMKDEEFSPFYDAVYPIRVRKKRLAINTFRMSFDPYVLGEQSLNRGMGGHVRFPHERFPLFIRFFLLVTRYRWLGRYREFLSDWHAAMELGRSARDENEFLTIAWEFHEKWKGIFNRSKNGGRKASGTASGSSQPQSEGAGTGSGGSGGAGGFKGPSNQGEDQERPPWDYRPPDTTHGYGSDGANLSGKKRRGNSGNELGATEDNAATLRMHGDLLFFEPSPHAREVFPWDQGLIRSETKSLARFLKVGREDMPLAGMTGRLISQKLFQPTLKVMNRASPFKEGGTELRILAIVDYSFSMDGWPHYYASHLTQVIHRSGIATTFDVVASSSRFQFRVHPDHLNLIQPDEMEGFQNLLPMIDRFGHMYDAAIVLTDCQISDKSTQALDVLRKKVMTIGCYVVPDEVEHVRGRPIEMVIEDGRAMFPSTFLYSDTFHGLGRRLALTLNRMKYRQRE